jgi:hypothetical protein
MPLISTRRYLLALIASVFVAGCGGGDASSAPPPTDFSVAQGNGQVTVTWTATPGVDYWIMYSASSSPVNLKSPFGSHTWLNNVKSPLVISGLTNGQAYSFAMDARINGGPGGAQTASVTKVPRLAGAASTWKPVSGLDSNKDFKGLAYGLATDSGVNYYIAAGGGGAIYSSPDLTNWSVTTSNSSVNFNAAVYVLGKFVAVGSGTSNNIVSSAGLSSWSAATTAVPDGLNAVATDGTTVVAVGDSGKIWYSIDASVWSPTSVNSSDLYGVAYLASGKWLAVGRGGVLLTSTNGQAWAESNQSRIATDKTLRAVTAVGGTWVAVGENGAILTSMDSGASWASDYSIPSGPTFYSVNASMTTVNSLTQFLAVGAGGAAYTSSNGQDWTRQSTDLSAALYSVLGSATQYIAVGAAGTSTISK